MNQLIPVSQLDQILELECEISEHITETSQCFTHFEYLTPDNQDNPQESEVTHLKIITYNPYHRKAFLLKEFNGKHRVNVLNQALKYIKSTLKNENNYCVHWTDLNLNQCFTSYFRGVDEIEVKTKFYCNLDHLNNISLDKIVMS